LSQEKQTGDQFDAESSFAVLYGREDWHWCDSKLVSLSI
jgi:hypothetical protein